jgi:hypothetical protein
MNNKRKMKKKKEERKHSQDLWHIPILPGLRRQRQVPGHPGLRNEILSQKNKTKLLFFFEGRNMGLEG